MQQSSLAAQLTHLSNDAVLHVGLLVAALLAHQRDLQLAEGLGQDVALGEELAPLHDVGFEQSCVILVTQHSLHVGRAEEGSYESVYAQNMGFVYVENNSPYKTQIQRYIKPRKSTY